jgi:type II secretory pathway pseudopilin PulG
MNMKQAIRNVFGFTLIELMVAVVVLLAVLIAVGRIFSTVITVSSSGIAIAETLQQATAIEQQLRADIARVSREGFIAIRHVAVPNDMNGYLLIDDSQPPEAIIRFDQLVIIRLGVATPTGIIPGDNAFFGQTLVSKVYYGHGVSFPTLTSYKEGYDVYAQDPVLLIESFDTQQVVTPWFQGAVGWVERKYANGQTDNFDLTSGESGTTNATQPPPSRWVLLRQSTSLGDDDDNDRELDSKKAYAQSGIATHTLFPSDPRFTNIYPHVNNGRVDIVSTHLGDVRNSVQGDCDNARSWQSFNSPSLDQQELIASLLQWPRVEPEPSSVYRQEVMLMKAALAQGCVSFQVEWTYDEGVGEVVDIDGVKYPGYEYPNLSAQPWWGGSSRDSNGAIVFNTLDDYHDDSISLEDWSTGTFNPNIDKVSAYAVNPNGAPPLPIIERWFDQGEGPAKSLIPVVQDDGLGIQEYWTIFGYNNTDPFAENRRDFLNSGFFSYYRRYTPRPSALKITLRLIDRDGKLGKGWVYEFIVDLPEVTG